MLAIAFDLVVVETRKHHPKGISQACADIESSLKRFGFVWRQGSVYTTDSEDLARLSSTV